MAKEYISREAAIRAFGSGDPIECQTEIESKLLSQYVRAAKATLKAIPAADAVAVVRCRECKYRIVNEHFGEKGYMGLKAMCELDTGDPFELGRNAEDDDWYCADGERKDGGQDDG